MSTTFTVSTDPIHASPDQVWALISDLEAVERYAPSVTTARYTSEHREGLGASRHCAFKPMGTVEERVVGWQEGERLSIEIYENTKIPFTTALVDFDVTPNGEGTRVDITMTYTPRFGVIGKAFDRFGIRPQLVRGMKSMATGIKKTVEADLAERA